MKILCKLFGHKVDKIDVLMNNIIDAAINREQLAKKIIKCERCGVVIVHKG